MINVAINGFGRIGRLVLRAAINNPAIEVVCINDLTNPATLAHLLRFDSVHGSFNGTIKAKEKSIEVNGKDILVFAEKDPEKIPWKSLDVDIAMECTGLFTTKELLTKHLRAGAKKVLLSAPYRGNNPVKTIVMGVNEHTYYGEDIVSCASCTTNCFAPMAKVINDNYAINGGVMTTIHSYTNDQCVLDAPHKDLRRGKAAALNIVPTSTGAADAISDVIPNLKGRCIGSAIRVPTPCGSMVHFVAEIEKIGRTVEEINTLFRNVSEYHMKGILEYSEEALVSTDIIGNPHSCIFDSQLTRCIDEEIIVVVGWYDNEWGYSNRMVDVVKLMMK